MTKHAIGERNDTPSDDVLEFIAQLNEHSVDFVLVGGYAMGVHGIIRATADIDFLYRSSKANVRRLCTAMERFGAPESVIDERALMTPNTVMQFGQPPYRIDTTFREQRLRVIGLTELRVNKSATGRKKDLADLRKLNTLARKQR